MCDIIILSRVDCATAMGFWDLFVVALMPVLKVLLVTAIGLFLATDGIHLLGASARNHLNNLVFYVFSPALIGSSLANTVTLDSLVTLWFMPVNILLTFIIGSALGWALVKITHTPKHLHGTIISCCSAGNLGNLLLIILPALCEENNSPFGDSTACSAYGQAYASLSMAVLAIYIWSYVYYIMRASASDESKEINGNNTTIIISPCGETSDYTEALLSEDVPTTENLPAELQESILQRIRQCISRIAGKMNVRMVLAPSTIAAMAGFAIGIISPIRKIMIGDSAPLRVIYSSANLLGEAAIPSITLIVGANLLRGLKRSGASISAMIGIIGVRFVVLPPIGIGVVKAAHHFGIVESDPLYQFTLMLQFAVPPAMNIGTIAQLVNTGESECSVIMLWTYAVASVSVTLWSAFFMWLVS
eukprot:XP_015579230.1 protein PIN-LIKES 3 isoform X1 [Ricinus communis]